MRKLTTILAAASLLVGLVALQASAQDAAISTPALKNQSPIVKLAACNGSTGHCGCAPGLDQFLSPSLLPLHPLLVSSAFSKYWAAQLAAFLKRAAGFSTRYP